MAHDDFYRAFIPDSFCVLGKKLLPLSLGHLIILNRIGSPFVVQSDDPADVGDLGVAVWVCSRNYRDGCDFIASDDKESTLYKWGSRLRRNPLFFWCQRRINWEEAFAVFKDYIEQGTNCPVWGIEENEKRGSYQIDTSPYQIVRSELLHCTSMTDEEILDRPWSVCLWDFISIRAMEGQLRMYDRHTVDDAQRKANEIQARLEAKWRT